MSIEPKIKVFILRDYYLPGYKSGGPIRTLANLIDRLGDQVEFRLFTRDRDCGDRIPYSHVQVNTWNQVGKAQVYYAAPNHLSPRILRTLIRASTPDIVYLNGFFSSFTVMCLLLFRFNRLPRMPIILAPRGEFAHSALQLKNAKKQAYLRVVRSIGLARNIIWQASSSLEAQDIRRVMGHFCRVHIAPNLPPHVDIHADHGLEKPVKSPGNLRLAFLARIAPMKNLEQALEMLCRLREPIIFDIYGPVPPDEVAYWRKCQEIILRLPANIQVSYHGPVPNAEVVSTLARYDFLLLPTLGENFGHIILESLVAGCPVLISNRTQWLDLAEKKIGWDIALEDLERWHTILHYCINMDNTTYHTLSQSAHQFALDYIRSPLAEQQNLALFTEVSRLYTPMK